MGNVSFGHRLPVLDLTGDVRPGGVLGATVQGYEPGNTVLLLSGRAGFPTIPDVVGPPLSAIPGAWFLIYGLGHNNGSDSLSFELPMVDNPIIQGLVWNAQAAVFADAAILLSNAATVVGGE